ncbi:prominin-1-A-like isoform X2 [Apostichopus japonicus]|uniref:prominin-1-A-like isoform X2 n=1 Tax=Stichopus japonicus TaxID=307972 RepID=UPI003AB4B5E0
MTRTVEWRLVPLLFFSVIVFSGSFVAGQNINDNGTLTFDALPEGDAYNIDSGDIELGGFTLKTTWNIIDGFLKLISPAGPPYDVIIDVISGTIDIDIQSLFSKVQGNITGFVVLFFLGLLFAIIFFLFLIFFCCCRLLCDNCGGKMEQTNSSNFEKLRCVYTGILLLMLFCLIFGAVTALAVSGYTSSQVSDLPDTINNNIDDMLTYVNNTVEEINFLIDKQLPWTVKQVSNDLNDVGDLVGVPVREGLRPTVGAAIAAVYPLANNLSATLSAMEDVNSTQFDLEYLYVDLDTNLSSILTRLDTQCVTCNCCSGFAYSGLSMNMDPRDTQLSPSVSGTFPQEALDASIMALRDVVDLDLSSAADNGSEIFENIPTVLADTTSELADELTKVLSKVSGTISSSVEPVESKISALNTQAEEVQDFLTPILVDVVAYDGFRDIAMTVVFGFILFLAGLFVVGVCLAISGCILNKSPPSKRSSLESCGGCVIMIAAVLSGLLVPPFMLVSSFTFITGGPIDRLVCDNVISREIFVETIDKPDAIIDGYFLGDLLFQNSSIDITVTGLLNACENNKGIYTAFKLENLIDIAQFTNIGQYVGDLDSQFDNITVDFSNVNILTGDTRSSLEEFQNSSNYEISWDVFLAELSKPVTYDVNQGNDLSVLAGTMRTAAATINNTGDKAAIEGFAEELDVIQTNLMAPFIDTKNTLESQIDVLPDYTGKIDMLITDTLDAADLAQAYLDADATSLLQANIMGFKTRILGYPYQFADYIESQIQNEVGKCLPVYNLYSSAVNTVCVGFIQAFNGFWYCLGLCCITMIFTFAFGVKSAKYYRRMDRDSGFDEREYGLPLTKNQVAPQQDD